MKNNYWAISLLIFCGTLYAETNTTTEEPIKEVKLHFIEPVDINKASTAKAKFSELTEKAKKSQLSEIILIGNISKKPQVGHYSLTINWSKYEKALGDKKILNNITPPLVSKLSTKTGTLPPDIPFIAKGDIDIFAKNIQKENSQRKVVDKAKDDKDEDKLTTTRGGGSSGGDGRGLSSQQSGDSGNIPNPLDGSSEATESYSYESCADRIDLATGTAHQQEREIITETSGKITERGACVDTGTSFRFETTRIDTCPEFVDQDNGLIIKQERVVYLNEIGEVIGSDDCKDTGESENFENFVTEMCESSFNPNDNLIYRQKKVIPTDPNGLQLAEGTCTNTGITAVPIIEYVECEPERRGDTVYIQQQGIYTDPETGNEIFISACSDNGNSVAVQREYLSSCGDAIDLNSLTAWRRFNEFATVDGKRFDFTTCITDLSDPLKLTSSYEQCGVRDDFVNGNSIQQESFHYTLNGNRVYVTQCNDSNVSYQHYLTDDGCTPLVDENNGLVTILTQVAYDISSQSFYPASCQPSNTGATELIEEVCDPEYEHNFSTNQSTRQTRYFYFNLSGQKQYGTACANTTTAFSHIEAINKCPLSYDLDQHLSFQSTETTFIDDTGKTHTIRECGERTQGVAYPITKTVTQTVNAQNSQYYRLSSARLFGKDLAPTPQDITFTVTGSVNVGADGRFFYSINGGSRIQFHTIYDGYNDGIHSYSINRTFSVAVPHGSYIDFWAREVQRIGKITGSMSVKAQWD